MAAFVVSLNLPWPSKFTKKLINLRLDLLESCRSFDIFYLETSFKKIILLVPGYKVHLQLLTLRFCGSFVLVSIAKRESFKFLGWKNQTVIRWNQCFRKDLHFLYFSLQWWSSGSAPARGSPASVSELVMTSQYYMKVEHIRNWLLSSRFAKFQQFWSEYFFFKFCLV